MTKLITVRKCTYLYNPCCVRKQPEGHIKQVMKHVDILTFARCNDHHHQH